MTILRTSLAEHLSRQADQESQSGLFAIEFTVSQKPTSTLHIKTNEYRRELAETRIIRL